MSDLVKIKLKMLSLNTHTICLREIVVVLASHSTRRCQDEEI